MTTGGTENSGSSPVEMDVAKLIAAGFAVISGAATLIGGLTGSIPRLLRNNSGYFVVSVVAAILAVGVTLWASQIKPKDDSKRLSSPRFRRQFLTSLGFLLFGTAAIVLIMGLRISLKLGDGPRVSVSWRVAETTGAVTAVVSVAVDGVKAADTLVTEVRPATRNPGVGFTGGDHAVFQAQTGASLDGVADLTFEVELKDGEDALQIVSVLEELEDVDDLQTTVRKAFEQCDATVGGTELIGSCLYIDAPAAPPVHSPVTVTETPATVTVLVVPSTG